MKTIICAMLLAAANASRAATAGRLSADVEGAGVAREIDSQYVVTYRPTRPLALAKPGEYRKVEVASRRVGLHLRSRQGYVVP